MCRTSLKHFHFVIIRLIIAWFLAYHEFGLLLRFTHALDFILVIPLMKCLFEIRIYFLMWAKPWNSTNGLKQGINNIKNENAEVLQACILI